MNIKHIAILLLLLVGSDLFIVFYGHYAGSTDDDLTISHFFEYIQSEKTQNELLVVFCIAIAIALILHFYFKV